VHPLRHSLCAKPFAPASPCQISLLGCRLTTGAGVWLFTSRAVVGPERLCTLEGLPTAANRITASPLTRPDRSLMRVDLLH
jgi:hypothetical protein